MTSVFGRIVSYGQVERWILDIAGEFFPEYLADVERELGVSPRFFPPVVSFVTANDWGRWPDERLPCLVVVDTGQADKPERRGGGLWSSKRMYAASIIVSGPTRSDTRYAAHAYAAAFRTLLLQHKSLGHPDVIGGISWVDDRPAPIPPENERSLGAMNMFFTVDVNNVTDERGTTPEPEPRPDPYVPPGDLPIIETAGPAVVTQQEIPNS